MAFTWQGDTGEGDPVETEDIAELRNNIDKVDDQKKGIIFTSYFNVEGAVTSFFNLGGDSGSPTESSRLTPLPTSGKFKNLYIYCTSAESGTTDTVLRVNQSDTALSLSHGSTGQHKNVTDVVSANQGDNVTIRHIGGSNSGSTTRGIISVYFTLN